MSVLPDSTFGSTLRLDNFEHEQMTGLAILRSLLEAAGFVRMSIALTIVVWSISKQEQPAQALLHVVYDAKAKNLGNDKRWT